ncbi:hypothetical protein ACQUSR_24425 [Streptomyces sp. P1-3]|uniref:hypothetical protein n=1 Tax=Streptomyces sp. P1-3 TaxID=3421658 RepID=UPI003D35DC29
MRLMKSAALGMCVAALAAVPAIAAPEAGDENVTVRVAGEDLRVPPAVADKLNSPEGWGEMSLEELEAAGVKPGMSEPGSGEFAPIRAEVEVTTGAVADQEQDHIRMDSMSGRNKNVRITLKGRKLKVDQWKSIGYHPLTGRMCTFAAYWRNGRIIGTSRTLCGDDIFQSWAVNMPMRFPDQTKLCNTWANIAGKPCGTVHD